MPRLRTLYSIGRAIPNEMGILDTEAISDPFKNIVKAIVDTCLCSKSQRFLGTDRLISTLKERNLACSKGYISKKLKTLETCGAILSFEAVDEESQEKLRLLELASIKKIASYFEQEKANKINKKVGRIKKGTYLDAVRDASKNGDLLSMVGAEYNRIDRLFCILDSAMRLSASDKTTTIDVDYYFSKYDFVNIFVESKDKSDIAMLADQRVIRIINGYYSEKIQRDLAHNLQPNGYVTFDINILCEKMGINANPENRDIVRNIITRLRKTEFVIDAKSSAYFQNTFGKEKEYFSYITQQDSISELEITKHGEQLKERFFRLKLHDIIVQSLQKNAFSFISHPALAREKSGLSHRINNWAKCVIGVRSNGSKPDFFTYTLESFHEKVHPASNFGNFIRNFLRIIKRESGQDWYDNKGSQVLVNLYGYFFQLRWNVDEYDKLSIRNKKGISKINEDYKIILKIWRDKDDPYVGNESKHNQHIRSSQLLIDSMNEDDFITQSQMFDQVDKELGL